MLLQKPLRPWAIAAFYLIAALTLASCVQPTVAQQLVPADGGTYVEAVVGRPAHLNPLLAPLNDVDEDVTSLVFSGLTRVTPTGEVVPDLAAEWRVSPDGLTYDFRLRADVVWHDGQPFGPEDVLFTVRAVQDPAYAGPPALAAFWRSVRVEQPDEAHVRFTLSEPFAPFPEYASLGVLPAHLLSAVAAQDLPAHPFNASPVGTGPYRVVSADERRVSLERHSRYYGQRPYLTEVQFVYYESVDQALDALRRGEALGLRRVPADRLGSVAGLDTVALYPQVDSATLTLLLFNLKHPLFEDKAVRQTLSLAIDHRRVAYAALGEGAAPADGLVTPASWAFDPSVPRHEYQPDRARALLDAAGWKLETGERYRRRAGQRLEFVLLTNDQPERVRAAEEISRELESVGVRAEVQTVGWTGLLQDFLVPGRFHAVVTGTRSGTADPDLYAFWHSSQASAGLSFGGWSSARADELLARARLTADRAGRARDYAEFQTLFADEVPAVPLYFPLSTYAVAREVKGVRIGLSLRPRDRLAGIADWYVRTRQVPGSL